MYFDQNATKRFQTYIEHYPFCQLNQTKRHKPYKELQLIHSSSIPFNTIAIDFVVALPEATHQGETMNSLLNMTDKFSKQLLLIPEKDTYTVKDWALILLRGLQAADWGMPS